MDNPKQRRHFTPPKHLRLPDYDYGQAGTYFVTLCVHNRELLFGSLEEGVVRLNDFGVLVKEELSRSVEIRPELGLDEFIIMPNHLHVVVWIREEAETHCRVKLQSEKTPRKPRSLSSFIAQFKAVTTKRINELRQTPGARVWQPNFYEHVIRDDEDLHNIRKYIQENPLKWSLDEENPDRE